MDTVLRNASFLGIIAGFLSGVVGASLGVSFAFSLLLFFLAGICTLYAFFAFPYEKRRPLFLFAIVLLGFGLGGVRFAMIPDRLDPELLPLLSSQIEIEGKIKREPRERESYREYVVEVDSGSRLLVRAQFFPEFSLGDRLSVKGTLELPASFETDAGRRFDYARYLEKEGISFVVPFAQVEKVADGGFSLQRELLFFKHAFMRTIERVIPEPESSLMGGILLGIDDAMGDNLLDAFRAVGLIHIVVLSGYNITLVAQAMLSVFSFLSGRKALLLAGGGIVLFTLMVGAGPSILRASLMALLVLLAEATGRKYDITRALLLAGTVMVLVNPMVLLFDLGFELSFLATIALIWIAPKISQHLTFIPEKFGLREIASATIATQLFVLPLLVYSVGTISLSGFIVNLLVLPFVPLIMLLGFLTGVLGLISGLLSFLPGAFAYGLLFCIISIAEIVSEFPLSTLRIPAASVFVPVICYTLFFGVAIMYAYRNKRGEVVSDVTSRS